MKLKGAHTEHKVSLLCTDGIFQSLFWRHIQQALMTETDLALSSPARPLSGRWTPTWLGLMSVRSRTCWMQTLRAVSVSARAFCMLMSTFSSLPLIISAQHAQPLQEGTHRGPIMIACMHARPPFLPPAPCKSRESACNRKPLPHQCHTVAQHVRTSLVHRGAACSCASKDPTAACGTCDQLLCRQLLCAQE